MRNIQLLTTSLLALFLLGCEKVATTEQVKRYYDSMSDEQIKQRYSMMSFSVCQKSFIGIPLELKSKLNEKSVCQCFSDKLVEAMDISIIRLALLPEEALSIEQRKAIQHQSASITQNIIVPQCFSPKR